MPGSICMLHDSDSKKACTCFALQHQQLRDWHSNAACQCDTDHQVHACRGSGKKGWREKANMALGVARGMQALEEAEPPILHRDLKPSNVLIDAGGCHQRGTIFICVGGLYVWQGAMPVHAGGLGMQRDVVGLCLL